MTDDRDALLHLLVSSCALDEMADDILAAGFTRTPSPEALPTCEKCGGPLDGDAVYVKGTEGVLHLNCSLRSE